MSELLPPGDAKAVPKPGDKEAGACKETPLVKAGEALSRPQEASFSNALRIASAYELSLAGLASQDQLLASLIAANDTKECTVPKNPEFPLKEPYDSEQAYQRTDGKPTKRGEELQKEATRLLKAAAKPDNSLSLRDHGKIMDSIAQNKDLSEADKWYLYKQVCRQEAGSRDSHGILIPGTHALRVLFDSEKPTGLPESGKGDVVRHIIIDPTNDGYHGGLVYGSASWRSGYKKGEEGIHFHEETEKPWVNFVRGQGSGVDVGDEQASYRQLAALRAMQTGGFNAYSKTWNEGFAK
jgi:hypothetical protein